jgi:hypothetical protein
MNRVIFPIAILALAGCEPYSYNRPGASIEQIRSDQNQCEGEAVKASQDGQAGAKRRRGEVYGCSWILS